MAKPRYPSGGTASAVVVAGGSALVMSGGTVAGAAISGGKLEVESGAIAMSSTVTFSGGTLIISDGTNTARLALIGHYVLAQFTRSADGQGGTMIVDPPVSSDGPLAPPH